MKSGPFRHLPGVGLLLVLLFWGCPSFSQEETSSSAFFPGKDSTVLVFAPHCDDETIACGGLFNVLAAEGDEPIVIMMTNGDAYTFSAEREYNKFTLTPTQYIRFAYERQLESISAMETLGLPADSIFFLGYPDRGLEKMWEKYWSEKNLYTSPYTRAKHSPYTNSYVMNAPYCGAGALKTIEKILIEVKPSHVILPDPMDWHPDHRAVFDLVTLALRDLSAKKETFAERVIVLTYLVHFGKWPKTRALRMEQPLEAPGLSDERARGWISYPLDFGVRQKKYEAMLKYESQLKTARGHLFSFVRANELFRHFRPAEVTRVAPGKIVVDGLDDEWENAAGLPVHFVGKMPFSALEKRADVTSIDICADEKSLYLRLSTRRTPSSSVVYRLILHAVYGDERPPALFLLNLRPPGRISGDLGIPAVSFRAKKVLELSIPLEALGRPAALSLRFKYSSYRLPEVTSQSVLFVFPQGKEITE